MSEFSFEKAYGRLEEILEKMNGGKASLDESLKLYEEADALISACTKRLLEAEQKIEKLIKNRQDLLVLSPEGRPQTEPFLSNHSRD